MKKILLLLIFIYSNSSISQTSSGMEQEFDYGIKNNSLQTITTPTYIGTFGTDGTQGKIPSAYIAKTTTLQTAETAPLNLFKIIPFTSGYEAFGIDFNSFPNSGGGAGTYNHGTWIGYNTGWHSGTPITTGKPSIMIGLEDNYFDNVGDLQFGTEFYVQGYSPNGTTVQMSRPFYARGFQKDNGNDAWTIISNIGAIGTNRNFTVREGLNNLFQITPNGAEFYTAETRINGFFKLQGGNFLMDNNRYFQCKKSDGSVGSIFKIDTDNTMYFGDIFNTFSNSVILKSGGISTLTLSASGNASFYGTATATSFIKSGGLSSEYLKADGSVSTLTNPVTGTGVVNYLSKFTSSGAIGNSLIFDNGTNVGIGTTSAGVRFVNSGAPVQSTAILGSATNGSDAILSQNGLYGLYTGTTINGDVWQQVQRNDGTATAYNLFLNPEGGRVAIGKATDDGVNKLQVNGSISATSFNGSATLTGTPTAPTATAGTKTTQIATTAFVQASRPYKVYAALLAQSGTSAPVATVLENTLGGTPIWAYSSVGGYTATLTGAFAINKTSVLISNGQAANALFGSYRLSDNAIGLTTTVAGTGAPVDGAIFNATIEIRVYN